jgi:dUTP pyrophosphatase
MYTFGRRCNVKIRFKLTDAATAPTRGSTGAAGWDIYSAEETIVFTKRKTVVKTGLSIELEHGYEAQVRSRSGLAASSNVFVLNSPGTIDEDYRGEVKVMLFNLGDVEYRVKKGERIAQLVVAPVQLVEWELVDELNATERGVGGLGSTGK